MAEAISDDRGGILLNIFYEIIGSPLNLLLVGVITILVYTIFKRRQQHYLEPVKEPELPKLKKDFTNEELKKYDGTGPDGRILIAVDGKVFDVTRGKNFYGPGGAYSAFAGKDASRGLATFSVSVEKEGYDDLSDLDPRQMEEVREWAIQFHEKYIYVGKLLKPGEAATNYSDEEEEKENVGQDSTNQAGDNKPDKTSSSDNKEQNTDKPKAE
ncbi:hypothetical protein LSTR_LSTR004838 [Laodelphax striatellus]|uniref:Cytochrome b5 heme-binding domain-containing protein n=1 Tax=Laodelphax striatellus TaxID=195883 RepID=A0A482WIS2_LAOST|nr:hypothetical protein LSTR_LSTR004838 [Laodelphax striatellus]